MPVVSVLMAVYNGSRFLREAIESILGQTFQDYEFLIIDDGSTDDTVEIVRAYADPRIRLVRNERNLGLSRSLNRGLSLARADLIARLDSDDVSEPERLDRQVAFMRAHPDVGLLGSWYQQMSEDGLPLHRIKLPCHHVDLAWSLLFHCPIIHSAVMLRRSTVLNRVGVYDEEFAYAMDYEYWCRISRQVKIANLDAYLVRYRVSSWSMTATFGERTQEGDVLSRANLADWLGWSPLDPTASNRRFRALRSLVNRPECSLTAEEIEWAVAEALRLHPVFCQRLNLSAAVGAAHRARILRCIGVQLIRHAYQYPERQRSTFLAGRRFLRQHRSTMSASENLTFVMTLLFGPPLAWALRRIYRYRQLGRN